MSLRFGQELRVTNAYLDAQVTYVTNTNAIMCTAMLIKDLGETLPIPRLGQWAEGIRNCVGFEFRNS